jgi:X-X-X-Leu-X-X-Gly heptad repeat protein
MNKKFVSALLALSIVSSSTLVYGKTAKDETVYASLKSDGSIAEIKVVNHIYGSEDKDYYTDYGSYKDIKNLSGYEKPVVNGSEIKWPMNLLKGNGLYYEGSIEKELPINVQIKYFLDGKEVKAEELGGKNGRVKIEFKVDFDSKNKELASQLMAQIQVVANQDIFKNIVTEGSKVVVGKKTTISFVALPPKKQSFVLEMDGTDIELEPISITLISSGSAITGDISENLNKLTDGLGELSQGSKDIEDGMSELVSGTEKFKNGMINLNSGIGSLSKASNEAAAGTVAISGGMDELHKGMLQAAQESEGLIGGINSLSSGLGEIAKNSSMFNGGISALNDGINGLSSGMENLSAGMDNLKSGHDQLALLAQALLNDPSLKNNAQVQALANGVVSEAQGINALSQGMKQSSVGVKEIGKNTRDLRDGYSKFHTGITSASESTKFMAGQVSKLPEGLKLIGDNFGVLKNGVNQFFGGFSEINKAIGTIHKETAALPSNIEKLRFGQIEIKNGINKLRIEGLDTIKTELQTSLKESVLGGSDKVSYTSFADNEKNTNSTVQFILRTPAIKKLEVKKAAVEEKVEKKGFIARLLDLFK